MAYPRAVSSLIGPWGVAILVVILFLVYGPKRLSVMARSMGKSKREFMHSITGKDEAKRPAELPAATPEPREAASPTAERDSD
jgi:TatA/E family protein of Tat protein translocase